MAVFHRTALHFAVEAVYKSGPNFIGFQLVTGARRWYIVGCYLSPDDTSMIERVVEALRKRPKGAELLVAGDMNANLADPEGDSRGDDIADALATEIMEDISEHFLLRRRPWCQDRRTWSMIREGREVQSRTDYILGTYRRLFENVSVRDPRHNSDHYLVLVCLHSASLKEHMWYLRGQKKLPLCPPTAPTWEDKIFAALRRAVLKPRAREAWKNEWISAATWRLVNERVSARRDPVKDQTLIRRHCHAIKSSMSTDRRRRAEEAGAEVEALVGADPSLIQGGRPPFNPGGMSTDKGVVQGCGQPCSAALSSYPRADHGGEGGTVQIFTTPQEEHPCICTAVPGG